MTAIKRTVLMCDGPIGRVGSCKSRFLGDFSETPASVRKRAKAVGWESWTTSQDMFRVWVDECPKHGGG